MNKKILSLILFPFLVLTSCNESTGEDFTKYLLIYEDFKNFIKEKDYKTLIKDRKYLYSESIISDNINTTLSIMCPDLTFYDAFKGECSSFYAESYTNRSEINIYEKWYYDGEFFNYVNISDNPISVVGKYGNSVSFDFDFDLKAFYQLFVDGEFDDVVLVDYKKDRPFFSMSFKEQYYFNQTLVEENTNLYFDIDDYSLMQIIQSKSFYCEENIMRMETKNLKTSNLSMDQLMDKSSDEYVDLSGTCLPNVEF